jgi:protoporphyrinogen oxidase
MNESSEYPVLIIGAGPAGLTAAYELAKKGKRSILIEKDSVVGGISRTVKYKGYHFDIGGHRFFTKVERVNEMWREVLADDFIKRPRLSHVYYKRKFFNYPIKPLDVVQKLGVWESFLCGLSYAKAKVIKRPKEESFEDYIVNNFGWRLYNTFFKSYTEKVWGIPCTEIKASWAAQRIKGLSLTSLVTTALFGNTGNKVKSLIEEFWYPKYGPGQMWEKTLESVEKSGHATIKFHAVVTRITHENGVVKSVTVKTKDGDEEILVSALISSIPIYELFTLVSPSMPESALSAAKSLNYRDYIAVALMLKQKEMFPDNWIYIHEPDVLVGRIQNYNNWSPFLTPDNGTTCLGLEYFCFKTDDIWSKADTELIDMAGKELESIGLGDRKDIVDGAVVRVEKTYPVYDDAYEAAMPIIRDAFATFSNLYPVGRNGMHRYNNQDHAMLTAMLAVENIVDGAKHNLWEVNVERVYHEEDKKDHG